VEERWRARFGDDLIDALRDALLAVVTPMPWSPPEVHPSDGFHTHVVDLGGISDEERPLVALLGQVLTGFTIDYEQSSEASLPVGANLLRVLGSGPVRRRELPAMTGLSKEGVAMAVGYLQRSGLAAAATDHATALTPTGLRALEDYRTLSSRTEDQRLRDALGEVLAQRDALSASFVPGPGGWRGETPYLAQTQRLVVDPIGALPWQPMVLHRGAWPDAN
jgi:hypothetical protein